MHALKPLFELSCVCFFFSSKGSCQFASHRSTDAGRTALCSESNYSLHDLKSLANDDEDAGDIMSSRTSVAKCYEIHCAVTFSFQFLPQGDIIAVVELGCRRGGNVQRFSLITTAAPVNVGNHDVWQTSS